jgi:hypothetical protein
MQGQPVLNGTVAPTASTLSLKRQCRIGTAPSSGRFVAFKGMASDISVLMMSMGDTELLTRSVRVIDGTAGTWCTMPTQGLAEPVRRPRVGTFVLDAIRRLQLIQGLAAFSSSCFLEKPPRLHERNLDGVLVLGKRRDDIAPLDVIFSLLVLCAVAVIPRRWCWKR